MKYLLFTGILSMFALGLQAVEINSENWKPVAQPDLEKAFTEAKKLEFEDVSEGPDECRVGPTWWVANPDGKSYDLVKIYNPAYMGPHEVWTVDFGTGKKTKQEFGKGSMFHLSPSMLVKGKLVCITQGQPVFWVYDPATNKLSRRSIGDSKDLRRSGRWVAGDDGMIYGVGWIVVDKQAQPFCYRVDPDTLEAQRVGKPASKKYKTTTGMYQTYATQGDWVYTAMGNKPWRLYAFNIKNGTCKVIAETEVITGNHRSLRVHSGGKFNVVRLTTDKGFVGIGGPGTYWVKDGQVLKGGDDKTPPAGVNERVRKEVGIKNLGQQSHKPPAGYEVKLMVPDTHGVDCWYKLKGEALEAAQSWASDKTKAGEWDKFELPVRFYHGKIAHIATLPNGRVISQLANSYGRAVTYDPLTEKRSVLGSTFETYSTRRIGDKFYLAGYPGCLLWEYDCTKPWTARSSVSPIAEAAKDAKKEATNPKEVAFLKKYNHVHMPFGGITKVGNRIYTGGKVIRVGNGGGFGWWDSVTGETGGMYKPFLTYQVFWLCGAGNRYVILSTKPVPHDTTPKPKRGRLFIYDTKTGEFPHKLDSEIWDVPGYVTEALPGLVMGYGAVGKDKGVLYGLDVTNGKILWTKDIPQRPVTGYRHMRHCKYHFRKGPDGWIWATMGGVLCRINPKNAEIKVVGKMGSVDLTFANDRVYVAGSKKLRRIKNLEVK